MRCNEGSGAGRCWLSSFNLVSPKARKRGADGRGGRGAHTDAVPEWRWEPGTRDQQGGESTHSGGRHRDGLVLVAVSATEPSELLVSGAIRPRQYPSAEGGDRGPRPEVVDRAVALPRVRRGAGGRQAEDGVTEFPVGRGVRTGVTVQPGGSRSLMAPGLTTRPQPRWGALPRELTEIRRSANAGWGDRPTWSARIEGRPRPFGQDECRGKLPGSRHSAVTSGASLETRA